MAKSKKKAEPKPEIEEIDPETGAPIESGDGEKAAPDEDSNELSDAEKVGLDADQMRVRVGVSVNGHVVGDTLVVKRDHPFYSAIIEQGLAEEVKD